MPSYLFSAIALRDPTLANRIVIAPMCQYSAVDGSANEWHLIHLGHMALSGAGLLVLEATGGRGCWPHHASLPRPLFGRQRSRPGKNHRNAAGAQRDRTRHPARPRWPQGMLSRDEGAWPTVAPSALPFAEGWPEPHTLSIAEMGAVRDAFVQADRAARIGFDLVEVHAAHGYLLHEFLSPISNRRLDSYGGSLENRMRFPLEVASAVRAAWPDERPMGLRITGMDGLEGGLTADDAVVFTRQLHDLGCDYVCVSSGGIAPGARLPSGPGYLVPITAQVKSETDTAVRAVGQILDPQQAEDIIATGQADMVAMGRALLDNPRWPWHAAQRLGAELAYPQQYARSHPDLWSGAKSIRP